MKVKIIYATKSGTTEECAKLLCKSLDTCQADISKVEDCKKVLEGYDMIILGTYLRFGKPSKAMKSFIENNLQELQNKKLGIYICCGYSDSFDEYIKKHLPKEVADLCFHISCFGGRLEPEYNKGIEKLFVKTLRNDILGGGDNGDEKEGRVLPTINENNIEQFADLIKDML